MRCHADGAIYVVKKTTLTGVSPENKKRANSELKIHRSLSHRFIVPCKECFATKDSLVLVMEYCEGGDLYQIVQHQRKVRNCIFDTTNEFVHLTVLKSGKYLPEDQILKWFAQLLLAVNYLHTQNMLHTDLKSANVFFTRDYDVRLGDFGMASISSTLTPEELRNYKRKREINGTPEYIHTARF